MNNPKKTHELIRQNEKIVKTSQKHDANLRKNSTLYFQVGLIVCLLAAYGLLEMTFETTIQTYVDIRMPEEGTLNVPLIETVKPSIVEPLEQKQTNNPKDFIPVPDDVLLNPFTPEVTDPQTKTSPVIDPGSIKVLLLPEDPEYVDFIKIEQVPIYPGCENKSTNEDKRKCMSDKITQLVQRKFNSGLGSELGLSGKQTIRTQFKIDKTGHVTEIKVRGTHPDLENEAIRVINIIPEMIPGKQHDKNVGVIYSLPIVFDVQN